MVNRFSFDRVQGEVAHDLTDRRATDVVSATEDPTRPYNNRVEMVHRGIGMDEMFRADFCCRIEIVPADGVRFTNDAVADF